LCVGTWLGWPGPGITPEDKIPESEAREVGGQPAELSSDQVVAVHLSPDDYELYYNGCCNATLWPLFHSMPDRAVFDETFWLAYKSVNEKFAQETLERLRQLDPVRNRRFYPRLCFLKGLFHDIIQAF
jgi:trehalose 6-phosphate synthase/phosphatase